VALKAFRHGEDHASLERTDRDLPVMQMLLGVIVSALAAAAFFTSLGGGLAVVAVGMALMLGFSFFFTSVAANAIATTARNPVSGMTMLTIITSSVVLLNFGVSGRTGMFFVMAIAGMVCTALSVSGQTITDLKTGYWLGSTPATQQRVKFLGVLVAAVAAGGTIAILAQGYQFGDAVPGDPRQVLPSPQAAIMRALVEGFMSQAPVAYVLFGAGAVIAVIMEMLGAPALIFALGMYLPLELNTPALVGGFLVHFLNRKSEREGRPSIRERGIVIASGLMAGGALGGVFGAGLRVFAPGFSEDWVRSPFYDDEAISQTVSALGFLAFCAYTWVWASKRPKEA
jgi:putative OPT family oligopeptide transporter